jgi:hypothetical protein
MPGLHTEIASLLQRVSALEAQNKGLLTELNRLKTRNKDLWDQQKELIKTLYKALPDALPKPQSKPMPKPTNRSYLEIHPYEKRMVESVIQATLQLGPGVYSIPHLHRLMLKLFPLPLFPSLSPTVLGKILKDHPHYFRSFRGRSAVEGKKVNFIEVLGTHHAPQPHLAQTPDGSS